MKILDDFAHWWTEDGQFFPGVTLDNRDVIREVLRILIHHHIAPEFDRLEEDAADEVANLKDELDTVKTKKRKSRAPDPF